MNYKVRTKDLYRGLFLALHADARGFPGGIRGLGDILGMSGTTLANMLNPDHEASPPSIGRFLEVIKVAHGRRAVAALAQLVGQVPLDIQIEHRSRDEAMRLFLALNREFAAVLDHGSDAAGDGRFDADERRQLELLLLALIQAAAELLSAIRA